MAITDIWAKHAGNPVMVGILTALAAATTATQIAAIQSQPEPYAKGGYIENEKIIRAGEKGKEWMASNTLLTDPKTSPIIAALENYQRGNTAAFNALGFSTPTKTLSEEYAYTSANFANSSENVELKQLNKNFEQFMRYMSDPKNRQATINRDLLFDFDLDEEMLRDMANL